MLLEDITTHEQTTAKIIELKPASDHAKLDARKNVTDLVLISDEDWQEAKPQPMV